MKLVITGNPGVGKHTSAKLIAKKLGAEIIDINRVAQAREVITAKTDRGLDVDVKKLKGLIGRALASKSRAIVVGHLAPYVVKRTDIEMVAVLRRSPYALEKTLERRKYSYAKVRENVASEILGVSMYDAIKAFGKAKVAEFDTTQKSPEQTATEIIKTLQGKLTKKTGRVDWLSLVSEKDDVKHFFEY